MSDFEELAKGRGRQITTQRAGTAVLYTVGESTRSYLVRANNKTQDEAYALYHSDVPALRSGHPTRPYLWCSQKQARQADGNNGEFWEVTCSYTLNNGALYPWNEPPVYSFSTNTTDVCCEFDLSNNKAIRNSAGCPFDPPVMATRYEATLQVTKNLLSFSAGVAMQYVGAVNSSDFYGAERGYCMCVGIPATSQTYIDENTNVRTPYWTVQYLFAFRNQFSWQPKVLDAGFLKKTGDGLVPITIGGREPSTPVPLNGSGEPLEDPDSDDPHYLDFKVYPEKNFNSLGV